MPEDPSPDPRREAESGDAPVVRTLLVCDLVGSTALVERLGDEAAFRLAHRHDRVARDLMERHGGREIDKTDGFLLLFRRPIEAVRFALDYHEALAELSRESGEEVRARVGIHLGEVILSENSPEDVARGAKPVEVEGLAKPMAARLMSLAGGGQTLLTRGAFELAARAARGNLPDEVQWLAHGAYRFRGVEEPVAVFEVGLPGRAPLRAPESSEKARPEGEEEAGRLAWGRRRWRGLAAGGGLLALAASVLAAVLLGRAATDAFAFEARDWVVVGDFQNLTGDPVLDDSLELAFRLGLDQSRFANVIPASQVRNVLVRMEKDPEAPVDRAVGLEVCQREAASALVLGSIAEVGGEYVVTGEVLQPPGGRTVVTETARARGRDGILDALETVTRKVRERLGEPLPAIEKNLVPLEKVTTADLEALRAYSLGLDKIAEGATDDALLLLERAVARDPRFASAHAKLGTVYFFDRRDAERALEHWNRALELRDRLPERERLYVEGSKAWLGTPEEMVRAWSLMATLFPDVTVGHHNLGFAHFSQHRFREAAAAFELATRTKDVLVFTSFHSLGLCQLALGEPEAALQSFEAAWSLEPNPLSGGLIDALVVLGRHPEAERRISELRAVDSEDGGHLAAMKRIDLAIDRGRLEDALRLAAGAEVREGGLEAGGSGALALRAARIALLEALDEGGLERDLEAAVARAAADLDDEALLTVSAAPSRAAVLGKVAARTGHLGQARRALAAVEAYVGSRPVPVWQAYRATLRGEVALAEGRPAEAVGLLREATGGPPVFEAHESLARALEAQGDLTAALAEWSWIVRHRGLAWAEQLDGGFGRELRLLAWNRADYHRGRLLERLGDPAGAAERYRAYLDRLDAPGADDPMLEVARRRLQALPGPPG
jgi:putative peptide modification system cyclase